MADAHICIRCAGCERTFEWRKGKTAGTFTADGRYLCPKCSRQKGETL